MKLPRGAAVASSGHRLLSNQKGNSRTPAFSPDGEKIVYSKEFEGHTSTLFVQELSGGVTRALTFGEVMDTDPVWSPDGEKVAFLSQKGCNRFALMIKVASNVTKPEKEVGEVSARGSMDWMEDGLGLLVSDRGVIQKITIGGSEREPLTSGEGDSEPRSSPNGKWIAFIRELTSGFYDLMLMGANGELPKQIASTQSRIAGLSWEQGSKFVVASLEKGASGRSLWAVPLDGSEIKRIAAAGSGATAPAMPRRASGLAFVVRLAYTNVWSAVPGKTDGVAITPGGDGDGAPQLSPDGKRIAWRSSSSGANEIWVANADSSGAKQLTRIGSMATGSPAWSVDGRTIVFDSKSQGQMDLYVIGSHGGEPKALAVTNEDELVPSFSRDGRSNY